MLSFLAYVSYDYMGLKTGVNCYCGTTHGVTVGDEAGPCDRECAGERGTVCGGSSSSHTAVYNITNVEIVKSDSKSNKINVDPVKSIHCYIFKNDKQKKIHLRLVHT